MEPNSLVNKKLTYKDFLLRKCYVLQVFPICDCSWDVPAYAIIYIKSLETLAIEAIELQEIKS